MTVVLIAWATLTGQAARADEHTRKSEELRQKLAAQVVLIEVRENLSGQSCREADTHSPSFGTGFVISERGHVLTAKHLFKRDVQADQLCIWAHWSLPNRPPIKKELDASSIMLSEVTDAAAVQFATQLPNEGFLPIDSTLLEGATAQQSEALYFAGYDGPSGGTLDTPAQIDRAVRLRTHPSPLSSPCESRAEAICDLAWSTVNGNSGAPVVTGAGKVAGMVVQHHPSDMSRGRFVHVGALAEFLRRHHLLSDERAQFAVYSGFGIFDYEARLQPEASYEACLAACAAGNECSAFSYYAAKAACLLSPSYLRYRQDARVNSGIRRHGPLPSVAAPGLSGAANGCELPAERLEVRIFKYAGRGGTTPEDYSLFHSILAQRLEYLPGRLIHEPGAAFVKGLQLLPEQSEKVQASPGPRSISILWGYHSRTLAILSGAQEANEVTSVLFWGDHHKHGLGETVSAQWIVVPADLHRERLSTHSAILLTALGIDAMERRCSSPIFLAFFGEAMEHILDLEARRAPLSGDLTEIRAFLNKKLVKW